MSRGSIVQVARTMPWHGAGGMETHGWQLAQAWRRRGWDVEILTTNLEDRDQVEERDGIRVHSLRHLPLNWREIPDWRIWHRFGPRVRDYALAHRIQVDAVHAESIHGTLLFRDLRRRAPQITTLTTIHGTGLQTYRETARPRLLERYSPWHPRAIGQWLIVKSQTRTERRRHYPAPDRLIAVSDALRDHMVADYNVPPVRMDVIANGVTLPGRAADRTAIRRRLNVPATSRLILYLGRLHPGKRVEKLVDHIDRTPNDRLIIAGAGPAEADLRHRVQRLSHPANVQFLGAVNDVVKMDLIAAADVLALPSDAEGQPITLLEALASGTPVYATRPWVPTDLVPLVASGDDVSAGIEQAIHRTDAVRRAADGIAKQHSWDAVAKQYEDSMRRAKAT